MDAPVKVVGALWCHDTRHTLAHLQESDVPFEFFNVDDDAEAREWMLAQNEGQQKLPTVDIGGLVLSIPSDEDLDAAIEAQQAD